MTPLFKSLRDGVIYQLENRLPGPVSGEITTNSRLDPQADQQKYGSETYQKQQKIENQDLLKALEIQSRFLTS